MLYPEPPVPTLIAVMAPAFPVNGAPQAKLLVFPPNPISHWSMTTGVTPTTIPVALSTVIELEPWVSPLVTFAVCVMPPKLVPDGHGHTPQLPLPYVLLPMMQTNPQSPLQL